MADHSVPPQELVEQIATEAAGLFPDDEGDYENVYAARDEHLANYFSQWGADQELEACCEWLKGDYWCGSISRLRAARRPNPPSLKQQALEQFAHVDRILRENGCIPAGCILAALKALPDE